MVGTNNSLKSFLRDGLRTVISGVLTSCSPSESGMMSGVAALFGTRSVAPSELMTIVSVFGEVGGSNNFLRLNALHHLYDKRFVNSFHCAKCKQIYTCVLRNSSDNNNVVNNDVNNDSIP